MQPLLLELGGLIDYGLPPGGAVPVGDGGRLDMVDCLQKLRVLSHDENATYWGDVPAYIHNR